MPRTFSQITIHIVFSTKGREPLIEKDVQSRLYSYMGGITKGERSIPFAIGGMNDHVHLMLRLPTDVAIADLVRVIKSKSSGWIHETFPQLSHFAWQDGYAAFSVSKSAEPEVKSYIDNQEAHHSRRDFRQELIAFLRAHEIEYDERYVFD
jgi:REP element-mobilizing transposase RayT